MIMWDDVYVIAWRDATGGAMWDNPEDVMSCDPITVIDVGFLLKETDESYTLTPCIAFDGDKVHKFARWICIPKGCIESIHRLPLKGQKRVRDGSRKVSKRQDKTQCHSRDHH